MTSLGVWKCVSLGISSLGSRDNRLRPAPASPSVDPTNKKRINRRSTAHVHVHMHFFFLIFSSSFFHRRSTLSIASPLEEQMLFITASLLMLTSKPDIYEGTPLCLAPYKAATAYPLNTCSPLVRTGKDAELLGLDDVLVPLSKMADLFVSLVGLQFFRSFAFRSARNAAADGRMYRGLRRTQDGKQRATVHSSRKPAVSPRQDLR
ncbi:hypothetical protein VPH35_118733 [Triticum aestivum]